MKRVTHSHEDGEPFRPMDVYGRTPVCRVCGAGTGQPCVRKAETVPGRRGSDHVVREDKGRRWYVRDQSAAPWPEDRIKGECYSTLPGCE